MKNILFKILIVFGLMVVGTSCEKDTPTPKNPQTTVNEPANTNPIGVEWELFSGKVFTKNSATGVTVYYDHFGPTKNISNLDIFTPTTLPFDEISKGKTTWKFTSTNQFILSGSNTYGYTLNNGIFRVNGLENGSSRVVEVLNSTENYMNVKVYEAAGSDGTNNFSFYTVLTFVKVGFTGTPSEYTIPSGYSYGGVLGTSTSTTISLVGTTWVVTHFIQNFVSKTPNDTLRFVTTNEYTWNSNTTRRRYVINGIVGSNMKSLSLYSFTTLGGDWSGQVQGTFMSDGVINNALFKDIMSTAPEARVSFKKLP